MIKKYRYNINSLIKQSLHFACAMRQDTLSCTSILRLQEVSAGNHLFNTIVVVSRMIGNRNGSVLAN